MTSLFSKAVLWLQNECRIKKWDCPYILSCGHSKIVHKGGGGPTVQKSVHGLWMSHINNDFMKLKFEGWYFLKSYRQNLSENLRK